MQKPASFSLLGLAMFGLAMFGLVFTAFMTLPAEAQEPGADDLKKLEEGITASAEKQALLLQQAMKVVEEQDALSNQIVALAETAAGHERQLAKSELRLGKLKTEIAKINLSLLARQDVIAQVLAGLQRLEHNPPPALVVAPDDVLDALRGALVFGAIVPELRQAAHALHDQLADLKNLRQQLDQQHKDHADALATLAQSRADILRLIDEKKQLALSTREELAEEKLRAEKLAIEATSLRQLLEQLAADRAKAEAKRTAEEKARADAEKALAEKQLIPKQPFSTLQGQVNFPAQGQIIKKFGEPTGLGSKVDGIVIATSKQAQVSSPATGRIEFSGKFRSYGQLVIVNAGEGYLVLLAGMEQTLAGHGQIVKAGEPVGLMGEKPGKVALSNGLTNLTSPVLYVEIRHNGDPVDSAPWWISTTQEAMR